MMNYPFLLFVALTFGNPVPKAKKFEMPANQTLAVCIFDEEVNGILGVEVTEKDKKLRLHELSKGDGEDLHRTTQSLSIEDLFTEIDLTEPEALYSFSLDLKKRHAVRLNDCKEHVTSTEAKCWVHPQVQNELNARRAED